MDSKVTAVKAWIGNPMVHQKADDSCAVMLDFASGTHAVFTHTGYAKEKGGEWSEGEYILTRRYAPRQLAHERGRLDGDGRSLRTCPAR